MFTGLKKMTAQAALLASVLAPWMVTASAAAADSVPLLAQAATPASSATNSNPAPLALPPGTSPEMEAAAEGAAAAPAAAPIRMVLLLPSRSGAFGAAADAVRMGLLTAYSRQKENIQLAIVETGDSAADMQRAYDEAASKYDILIGPLSRSAVTAVAQSGRVNKPTVALAQPDMNGEADLPLPPQMLAVGLSIDEEARQVANWVEKEKAPGKIFAVSTGIAWQKRAARSFQLRARQLGLQVETLELSTPANALSAPGLAQLAKRVEQEKPALIFVALDAAQTAQLRSAVGNELPLYGTSQINPYTLKRDNPNDKLPELDGVRLIDIPWQLQPDNLAVARYPRPAINDGERPNADLARLYALGIDAYRVAYGIAQRQSSFDIDGVTGRLNVNMNSGGATFFQRQETQAVYQDGWPVPLADQY
ncbi:LppC family lipoprotein [Herbaspirillum rubrisubalbicans M1]|uniref:penicillin-binding protein activator n=1 Tax=Herbaspirillum rubrisubalbicans TaxID=80842 RepID=UPI00073A3D96|nr:penicillin-binding protein activator [Herbaspirillum rubrisubalbicans]ALU91764.1 LppC family lipoprotein [Herbaspirillum rubrisubalbicans M1]